MKILFSIFILFLLGCSSNDRKLTDVKKSTRKVKQEFKNDINDELFEVAKIDYHHKSIRRVFVVIPNEKVANYKFIKNVICSLKMEFQLDSNSNLSFFTDKKYADYKENLFKGIEIPEGLTFDEKDKYMNWMNLHYLAEYDLETKTYSTYPVSEDGNK